MLRIANAPVSWGIADPLPPGAIGYGQVLDEIRATGYAGTELGGWGFLPTEPAALRAELDARQLALLGSWVSVYLHDPERYAASEAEALRTARLLAAVGGPDTLIVLGNDPFGDPVRRGYAGRIGAAQAADEAQLRQIAAGAEGIARAVRAETGLRTVFHHHIGTLVETPEETAALLAMTDPELLGLCFDTGHCRFGGGDPVAMLRRHAERVWYVHFKDHDPAVAAEARSQGWDGIEAMGHGVFCELGRGDVAFPAVIAELATIGYDGWVVVEQDVLPGMGSPAASARRNRDYLRSLGL